MNQAPKLQDIIKQCQKGQPQAWAWIVTTYGKRLYGYFYRCTGSINDAEDLLQELFVRLLEHIKEYREEGRFESWLFRIAANLVRDRLRKGIKPMISLHQDQEGEVMMDHLAGPDCPPSRQLDIKEQKDQLQAALEQLPELDRELILARHFGSMSFKELAESFHLPLGTVLAKIHRGMKTLRRMITV